MLPKERGIMSPQTKKEYLDAIVTRFRRSSKKKKSIILDEVCATCNWHRKHAIRVLKSHRRFSSKKQKKRGKPSRYQHPELLHVLKTMWLTANLPCAERLKTIIPLWLPSYQKTFSISDPSILSLLLSISISSIKRVLRPVKAHYTTKGRSSTKPGTLLRKHIPIKTNQWEESRPGFMEADTVAHCGSSLLGQFMYTLDMVDIATSWSEQRAVWGKGESGVLEQIKDIERVLPFPVRGFDSDNGSEFLNYHLLRHCTDRSQPIQFTRARAYHSNDNAPVEQKNFFPCEYKIKSC